MLEGDQGGWLWDGEVTLVEFQTPGDAFLVWGWIYIRKNSIPLSVWLMYIVLIRIELFSRIAFSLNPSYLAIVLSLGEISI